MYFIADIDRFLKKHPNIYIIENGKKRYIKDDELRNAMKKHAENIGVELFKTNLLRKRRF